MATGIDISQYQANIQWGKVKQNVDFVIIRSGFGYNTEDTRYVAHINGARDAGIPIAGIYHFSYAISPEDARIEAEFAIKQFNKMGLDKNTCAIFYDFEYDSVRYGKDQGVTLGSKECISFTEVFCGILKSKGYKYGVYCNNDYYNNYYNRGKGMPEGAVLWYADYRSNATKSIIAKADIWQKSSTGRIDGINGNVDINESTLSFSSSKSEVKPITNLTEAEVTTIANDVIAGKYGNGDERKKNLGSNYTTVQNKVNEILSKAEKKPEAKKVDNIVVADVIAGKYGNGDERIKRLTDAGYIYREVQDEVNKAMKRSLTISPAKNFDNALTGKYVVKASALNLRYIPGLITNNNVVKVLNNGTEVQCWGYYTEIYNKKWFLVQLGTITGFVDSTYVTKL